MKRAALLLAVFLTAMPVVAQDIPLLKDLRKAPPTPAAQPEKDLAATPDGAASPDAQQTEVQAQEHAAVPEEEAVSLPRPSILPSEAIHQVPLLSELRKPIEVKEVEVEEEVVLPEPIGSQSRIDDIARVCPQGAVWYMAVPEASRFGEHWGESPVGKFFNEPAFEQTLRNNHFGLAQLFSDLPASAVTPDRMRGLASCVELAKAVSGSAKKAATAGYIDENGRFSLLFLIDVGLDRVPSFETLALWETSFFVSNPGAAVKRGDHSGNFLDVWTLRGTSETSPAEIAAGYAENILVIANDAALAQRCLDLATGEGESLAESPWGERLAASASASANADAIGFLRMDALLEGLKGTPIALQSVASWADYIGHGGRQGEAMYYGVQFSPEETRETFLLPVPGQSASSSLLELLAKRLRPGQKWTTPNILPYQPNPKLFLAAWLEGRQLGQLLRQERRLFGLSNENEYFTMPAAARRLFTNDLLGILTGEVGLAFYPGPSEDSSWIMALPCTGDPTRLLPKAETEVERSGAILYSRGNVWRESPCWTVLTQDGVRRLSGSFLLIASHGDLLVSTVDQLMTASSFANNRDFTNALSRAESEPGLIFYLNLPELAIRQYPNLSQLMRTYYPRSSGLNSRPPLAMLRRYARGVMGAIAPAGAGNNGGFTRVTVQAPAPVFAGLAAGLILNFPRDLRREGRLAMKKSRDNLQALWLRTQLYSSRFGHFPDRIDDLLADLRASMTADEVRGMATAPATLSLFSPAEAMRMSYSYLAGAMPNDEPDLPLFYESRPWSEDFSGMYPVSGDRAPSESGEFVQYRQFIRLDGRVVTMTEKRFDADILPRLRERE